MTTIRVYTLSYCPWCKKTKRWFAERGIDVTVVDYDLADREEQKRIEAEIKGYSGGDLSFPFVVIGADYVMGHHPDRYAALLGLDE